MLKCESEFVQETMSALPGGACTVLVKPLGGKHTSDQCNSVTVEYGQTQ